MSPARLELPLTKAQTLWFAQQKLMTQVFYLRARFHKVGLDPDAYNLWGFDFTPGTVFIPCAPAPTAPDDPAPH